MFERKDAHLKFKRGRNAFLGCATISVTWERQEKPVSWTWNRFEAIKGICRAHWDGPCDAFTESEIRDWCHGAIERILAKEALDALDPVVCFWNSLSDTEKRQARQNMDWDDPRDVAQQAYEKAHGAAC